MSTSFVKKPNTEPDNSNVTSNTSNAKRQEYITILNNIRQLQYNPAILGKVDMEIRGDPYWLTPRNVYIKSEESISNPRLLNIFYIKVGFPFDETNGKMIVDNYISRLYQTSSVISEFNNGKFTQKLSGSVIQSITRMDIEQEL
jgi:hypothetical protein